VIWYITPPIFDAHGLYCTIHCKELVTTAPPLPTHHSLLIGLHHSPHFDTYSLLLLREWVIHCGGGALWQVHYNEMCKVNFECQKLGEWCSSSKRQKTYLTLREWVMYCGVGGLCHVPKACNIDSVRQIWGEWCSCSIRQKLSWVLIYVLQHSPHLWLSQSIFRLGHLPFFPGPLIFYPWIAIAHFVDFQVRSLSIALKKISGSLSEKNAKTLDYSLNYSGSLLCIL